MLVTRGMVSIMEPVAEVRRNFLFGGYKLEYRNRFELPLAGLSRLVDAYFSSIYPELLGSNGSHELVDFKGRDPHDLLDSTLPRPAKDELFLLGGRIAIGAKKGEFEWDDFLVSGTSAFRRFEGSHHIIHACEIERTGALPSWIPIRLLGRVAPLEPTIFRFGLEHFKSSIFSASFGYAPSVMESIIVDACRDHLLLKVSIESKVKDPRVVFEQVPILAACLAAVGAATDKDVLSSYLVALQSA